MRRPNDPGSPVPLPDGYTCRRPRRADIAAIVAMQHTEETALIGESDASEEELLADWHIPRFCRERDAWLVEAPGRPAVGYGWIWDRTPPSGLYAEFHAHPDDLHRDAVSAHLLAHIEVRADEYRSAAGGGRVLLGIPIEETDDARLRLLVERGYAEMRRFHRMHIDLREGFTPPVWPPGIEVREFRRGRDEGPVHQAIQEAFAESFRFAPMTLNEWRRHTFANKGLDTWLWLVAWEGAEVVGTCVAFVIPGRGYVDDLAVCKPWRRRGIGLALLLESFARLAARGQTEVVLGVDSENTTGALALYARAGMRIAQTRLFLEKDVGEPT
jgi:mycothiol synthase